MTIIDLILQIIKQFQLVTPTKQGELTVEAEQWEETARENSDDKIKAMYGKLFYGKNGFLIRIIMPIIYFWVRKELTLAEKIDEDPLD